MTDQATRVVPAGWYQDPAAPDQVRWWNGVAWTEHVRDKPSPSQTVTASGAASSSAAQGLTIRTTATEAGPATTEGTTGEGTTQQRIADAREWEGLLGVSTSEHAVITRAPASSGPAARGGRTAHGTATGSAWLIALTPLLALALGIVAAYVYFYVAATAIVFVVAAAVPYLLAILWAIGDGRALKARGFTPPSAAFALLTALGYLIARRVRVPGSGALVMLLVVGVLAFGSLPVAALLGQLQGLANALKIQSTISADYISHGQAVSVSCPAFVDASTPGTFYTCDATTAIGTVRQVWVSIDGTDGRFSYALAI